MIDNRFSMDIEPSWQGFRSCVLRTRTPDRVYFAEGRLDPDAPVTDHVPELTESGFGTATVRQVMDMTTGIRFDENYDNPDADIWVYSASGSAEANTIVWAPGPHPRSNNVFGAPGTSPSARRVYSSPPGPARGRVPYTSRNNAKERSV